MDSALKRFFEPVRLRFRLVPLAGVVCAGGALAAAVWFGGSAAGILCVCAATAAWIIRARVHGNDAAADRHRLTLISSISLPGGGRVHEVRRGTRTFIVGCAGNRLTLLDAHGDGDEDA